MVTMYRSFRFMFSLIVCIPLFVLCRKKKAKIFPHIFSVVSVYILTSILLFLPVENFLGIFKTPQDIASYCYAEEIALTVEGDSTALLVFNGQSFVRINKSESGWKYDPREGSGFDSTMYFVNGDPYYLVYIFQKDDTTDKYLYLFVNGRSLKNEHIVDTNGNELICMLLNEQDESFCALTYYGCIGTDLENYGFYLDGELILLDDLEPYLYELSW